MDFLCCWCGPQRHSPPPTPHNSPINLAAEEKITFQEALDEVKVIHSTKPIDISKIKNIDPEIDAYLRKSRREAIDYGKRVSPETATSMIARSILEEK